MTITFHRTRAPSLAYYAEYGVKRDGVWLDIQITRKESGWWAAWRHGECWTDAPTLADLKRNVRELLEVKGK